MSTSKVSSEDVADKWDTEFSPREVASFWRQVRKGAPDECWPWTGFLVFGYGYLKTHRRSSRSTETWRAPRVSWLLHRGRIPRGMHACHACDNRACVNPAHLFLGTPTDNLRDASRKGRLRHGEGATCVKLTPFMVRDIRVLRAVGVSQANVARHFGIHDHTVYDIERWKTWKHLRPTTIW